MSETQEGLIYSLPSDDPLDIADLVVRVQRLALLPDNATWWFGWNEQELVLPGRLNTTLPDMAWDALQIFSPRLELRVTRQGRARRVTILAERPLPLDATGWVLAERCRASPGVRLLAGAELRLATGMTRGVVALPRPLEYGVDPPPTSQPATLIADVWQYDDDEGRLRTVRYSRLRYVPTGSARVHSLSSIGATYSIPS